MNWPKTKTDKFVDLGLDPIQDIPGPLKGPISHVVVKAKLAASEYTVVEQHGRSKVWAIFRKIIGSKGVEIKGVVLCRTCGSLMNYYGNTSNLIRHKCYKETQKSSASKSSNKTQKPTVDSVINTAQKSAGDSIPNTEKSPVIDAITMGEITLAVTKWCIKNCHSCDISADEGLHDLLRVFLKVSSRYGPNIDIMDSLPNPTTVARAASESFEQVLCTIKGELAQIKEQGFSITSDIWTDMFLKRSYISVSIHYIHEHKLFNRLLAMRSVDGESITGQQIQKEVEDCLHAYNLDLAGAIIVTDRGSEAYSAFKLFDYNYCINHLLNNVVEKSFRDVKELKDMKLQATKLVKYLKMLLKNIDLKSSIQSDCHTRWNGIFYTLKSIEVNWHQIRSILTRTNQLDRVKHLNYSDLTFVVEILSHFEEASKSMQNEQEPTLHRVIPHLRHLAKIFCRQVSESSIGQILRQSLCSGLEAVFPENFTKFHKLALFLFLPTNLLLLFNEDEKTQTMDHCKELMKEIIDNSNEYAVKDGDDNDNIFSDFTGKFDAGEKIEREIRFYINFGSKFNKNFSVLDWWKTNQTHTPIMYKLACKIMSIPASSFAAEKVFSKARNLFCEQGNLIENNPNMLNEILFLNDNSKLSNN